MKNKNILIISLSAIAIITIIVALSLYYDNEKSKNKIKELEEDKLKLILDSLRQNTNLSDEIKQQIQKLIGEFKNIDIRVSNELAQALQLLQIGQVENAIEDLVKIIEHLLITHYQNNNEFNTWLKKEKKKKDLHNLLAFCKKEEKINDIEFQFFLAIKTIRNKEDHTLDLNLDNYLNASGLITAIGGIFKLSSIVYPNKNSALA